MNHSSRMRLPLRFIVLAIRSLDQDPSPTIFLINDMVLETNYETFGEKRLVT